MSSSSKPRTISPFKFRKPSSSFTNGKLAGSPSASMIAASPQQQPQSAFAGKMLASSRDLKLPVSAATSHRIHHSSSISSSGSGSTMISTPDRSDIAQKARQNVTVTVRFRPLSAREIQRGDEVAWYADGDTTVRSEFNPAIAYLFDRVFGPATTTRHIYDVAGQHIVSGAMQGVNGTVFAYGVTSSGKTHTMHGDQKSPGIIPLAIKDVFSIIQETPNREFLLRVSYLEIYNEVINDLLDPAGQNLKIREDAQGTYVEGIKEEVVLSPAHALSLIAAGEEHRHVGSNNFNLLSSRSHTIFTLTVECSPRGDNYTDDEVTLSQLNLIDLAGSESSKTETTGLRRKEGSYINKSLLTLGTVIAKLTDGKATHVPYRDSKLTRLLQSSLSGHGRVSLICTVTPASSNNEETHNTLKFAHRAKHVEIHASQNRILDEKSLIKKYQKEIYSLKQELEQLKKGVIDGSLMFGSQEDLEILKQQLEAGQVKLKSRLEEEEQAKAALMGRIQRLTKLILVSTKNTVPSNLQERPINYQRRRSFGEEELAYLPSRKREFFLEEEDSHDSEICLDGKGQIFGSEDILKDDKKAKKRSMLGWFKMKKSEHGGGMKSSGTEISPLGSPATNSSSGSQLEFNVDLKGERRKSVSRKLDDISPFVDSFPEPTQAGELFSATVRGRKLPPTGTTMADQMDLLREQVKMLAGEVALCTSSLKRLSEQVINNPEDTQIQVQMQRMQDEIQEKQRRMRLLEQRIIGTEVTPSNASPYELSQTISRLTSQLNEKSFELEIKTADNRILQEQLQAKVSENNELQESILMLQQQLTVALEKKANQHRSYDSFADGYHKADSFAESTDNTVTYEFQQNESHEDCHSVSSQLSPKVSKESNMYCNLQVQILQQATELDKLKQEKDHLLEEKVALEVHSQKVSQEASYAKELASAAAIELKTLAEEISKLSYRNAKLAEDLKAAQESAYAKVESKLIRNRGHDSTKCASKMEHHQLNSWRVKYEGIQEEFTRELKLRKEREIALESALAEKEQIEVELKRNVEEGKQHEASLENDLAGMWVLVANLKKEKESFNEMMSMGCQEDNKGDAKAQLGIGGENDKSMTMCNEEALEGLKNDLHEERRRATDLELIISHLKSENLDGLDIAALEDLSALHVEALTKLYHAKEQLQEKMSRERDHEISISVQEEIDNEMNGHVCKICFEAPTSAVLLPCRHYCLCKPCAVACTECPLCRTLIQDRIVTYTS